MSAPEARQLSVGTCALDAVELILRRGQVLPAALPAPARGEARWSGESLSACVQPGRWLVLAAPAATGALAARCAQACADAALVLARGSGLRGIDRR